MADVCSAALRDREHLLLCSNENQESFFHLLKEGHQLEQCDSPNLPQQLLFLTISLCVRHH